MTKSSQSITIGLEDLSRGDVALFSLSWDTLYVGRVVGVPGDRVQVRAGKLIRNGKPVDEPYCQIPYSAKLDRFASAPEGDRVTVHEDSYVLLKDDRNGDSRSYGPVTRDQIVGRVILAYSTDEHSWWHVRLVH